MTRARTLSWLTPVIAGAFVACGGNLAQQQERNAIAKELSGNQLVRSGDASVAAGDSTRAEQYYAAALRADGIRKATIQKLLVVCVTEQRYPVALEYAESYLHQHPEDPEMLFAAGSLHAVLGERQPALRMLTQVVHQRPKWSEAHYALATILRQDALTLEIADQHDLEYLRLEPSGPLAESARARLRRVP